MTVSMSTLITVSLYSAVLGAVWGVFYDIIRICRALFLFPNNEGKRHLIKLRYNEHFKNYLDLRCNKAFEYIFVFLGDAVFSVFVTASFILFLFYFNYGIFRWFILAFAVLGYLIYYNTVGKAVMIFSFELSQLVKLIINLIIFVVKLPILLIIKLCLCLYRTTLERIFKRIKRAIDIKRKKRYTVKCKEKLKTAVSL